MRAGLVDNLKTNLARSNMEDVHAILENIDALKDDNCMASVRLVRGGGGVIDHVGNLLSLESASFRLDVLDTDYIIMVMAAPKPVDQQSFKIAWLGLDGAGKSALLNRIKFGEYCDFKSSVGLSIETINFQGHLLENYDFAGTKILREKWFQEVRPEIQPDLIAFIVDSNLEKLAEAEAANFLEYIASVDSLQGIPVVVVANKQDVQAAMEPSEIADHLACPLLLGNRRWTIIGTSAKTGTGIEDFLFFISEALNITPSGTE